MDVRVWKVLTIVLSAVFFISLVFLILFGFRIVSFNKVKENEISKNLATQEKELLKNFQVEKEADKTKFTADALFGNFSFEYPRVWFTNAVQEEGAETELLIFADPKMIVVKTNAPTVAGLRVQVFKKKFEAKVVEVDSKNKSSKTVITKSDVTLSSLKGKKYVDKNTVYVLLPLRDKTLYIGTDDYKNFATQYQDVLNSFAISR